jgi:hypothetical protein
MALVNVACKLPAGLTITHKGKTVTLVGSTKSGNRFGFGITRDVDGDWFKDWATTDAKDFPPIKNGSIFAMAGTTEKIADAGAERRADPVVQTGLEPLDPSKPGKGVEPTDETKKALSETELKDIK